MRSLVHEPLDPRVDPASTPDVIDLRAEGAGAIEAFGEELEAPTPVVMPAAGTAASTLTYERYYGLREKPFSLSTDPRFLYRSGSHASVLEDLDAAIRRREGLIVLTGDIGLGKTTLCRAVLSQLDRKTFATFVPDPFVTREDLLKTMLIDFGVMSVDDLVKGRLKGTSRPDLSYPLYEFLQSLEPLDAFAVLVIDEVQNLSLPLLEEIRILSDLEAGRKLLQVVLVGQPEFEDQLRLPRMRQIAQRVTVHCTLRPLDREEVSAYVPHRLRLAGGGAESVRLTQEAVDLVHHATGGVPRVINLLCDKALSIGQRVRTSRIGPELVLTALADLRMKPVEPGWIPQTSPGHAKPVDVAPAITSPAPAASTTPADDVASVPQAVVQAPFVDDERSKGLFEARAGASVPPHNDDLLALLDLPAVDLSRGDDTLPSTGPIMPPPPGVTQASGKVWRGVGRLRPAAAAALVVLGATTGVSAFGYWVWLRPALEAPVALPAVPRPPVAVAMLGPLQIEPPARAASSAPVETQAAAAPSAAAAVAADTWAVQTGAFSGPERAAVMVARLQQLGYRAFARDFDFPPRGRFRVALVGPFASREQADATRDALRRVPGLEGSLVRRVGE